MEAILPVFPTIYDTPPWKKFKVQKGSKGFNIEAERKNDETLTENQKKPAHFGGLSLC